MNSVEKIINAINVDNENVQKTCYFNEVPICPRCHTSLRPEIKSAYYIKNSSFTLENSYSLILYCYCTSCRRAFLREYRYGKENKGELYFYHNPNDYPSIFNPCIFSDEITALSPNFVKIYNQSLHSEMLELNEISGMGYRKALEFLIKDYCIHCGPNEKERIKSEPLSKCITKYIQNKKIETLAQRCSWIGNDETHYVKLHEDRDIEDLKKLMLAAVRYIEMELAVEDAESIENAKK